MFKRFLVLLLLLSLIILFWPQLTDSYESCGKSICLMNGLYFFIIDFVVFIYMMIHSYMESRLINLSLFESNHLPHKLNLCLLKIEKCCDVKNSKCCNSIANWRSELPFESDYSKFIIQMVISI